MRRRNFPLLWVITAAAFLFITLLPVLVLLVQWLFKILTGDDGALSWIFSTPRSLELLGNSLLLATVVTLLSLAMGIGLALWLTGRGPLPKIIGAVYLLPLLIPPYIHALDWMTVAGKNQLLNRLVNLLPGLGDVTFSTYGFLPAAFVLTIALFPIVTLLVNRGLAAIHPELLEAGWLTDASPMVWRRVVLPLIAPYIVAAAGLVFVLILVEYGVPSLCQYNVYIMEVYSSFSLYFNPVRAFATALPVILIAVIVLAVSQLWLKNSPLQSRPERPRSSITQNWPVSAKILPGLCAAFWVVACLVPLVVLIARSNSPQLFGQTFTTYFPEIRLTIIVAACSGLLAAVIAVPLANKLTRRGSRFWWLLMALPLAVPAPLVGISMIHIWNTPALDWGYGTPLMLVLVQTARFLPFALFTASASVRNIDPLLIEASRLPDIGYLRRFYNITLPLFTPAVIMTWLVTFILSLGELGASLLVAPPGQSTLPIIIYNLLHYGATDTVSVMSLIIVLAAGIACALMFIIYKLILRKPA
jgi:iron(III) transport system permease protein